MIRGKILRDRVIWDPAGGPHDRTKIQLIFENKAFLGLRCENLQLLCFMTKKPLVFIVRYDKSYLKLLCHISLAIFHAYGALCDICLQKF